MKFIKSIKTLFIILLLSMAPVLWSGVNDKGSSDHKGAEVFIITHDEIINSGAGNLAALLSRVPGVRISMNSSQSQPSAGPLVSADSPVQLSANQFSRILILFNGHSLNKSWYGGANQEWGTGFLEGLKEIRIYKGPSVFTNNGVAGTTELIIDLIPFKGSDRLGSSHVSLSQSFNNRRADRSLVHLSTGDKWGDDGNYAMFADFT